MRVVDLRSHDTFDPPTSRSGLKETFRTHFEPAVPLCVDLDGTLIATDLLWESLFAMVRTRPWGLVLLPVWLLKGRANLKFQVMERSSLDVDTLPYRRDVLAFLKGKKQEGQRLVLATASQERLARQIADHLGLFDEVLGSDEARNLKGPVKLEILQRRYGATGFDYIGDSKADLRLWRSARQAHLVARSHRFREKARGACTLHEIIECPDGGIKDLFKALRPHQWAKNLLLFVPLITAHLIGNLGLLLKVLLAFVAFSLAASAIYVLNDLLDLQADRKHHSKHRRPFASGRIPIAMGVALHLGLIVLSLEIALLLPTAFVALLLLYLLLTTAYSIYLKQKLMVDVICLAGLYTHRILAGASVAGLFVSPWLMAFTLFFFLSLAFAKRYTELVAGQKVAEKIVGRGYMPSDLELIRSMGPACGYLSLLVLCLYINSPDVRQLYRWPEGLWLLCPLFLYWISRLWFLACRQQLVDDPVLFAIKDRISLIAGVVTIAVLAVSI